jgi:hypothetical protein
MKSKKNFLTLLLLVTAGAGVCLAQWGRGGRRYNDSSPYYTEGGVAVDERTVTTAREVASHSTGTPTWTNAPDFARDVFTFARIIRDRDPLGSYSAGNWITDFPDSDLNLSFRVQQMTTIKTSPDGRILRLTNPDLYDYPWIYMVEPGALLLHDDEVAVLRKYLLNGGFLMADDFWGERHWQGFNREMKKVFPEREFVELPMDHPIFHAVFPLKGPKSQLQTPSIHTIARSRSTEVTWEYHDGEECKEMHVRAMFDDKGRIMILATHNTDNGDGWEREGEDDFFFHEFSEKRNFPLGINIIVYAMTH